MKWMWPWKRRQAQWATKAGPATLPPRDPIDKDLEEARKAAEAARQAFRTAQARRPAVTATGRALERTVTRNHLAELVRSALGSGS